MKGVIMAGGMGTRARPFTDFFPKALMPAGGRPIIQYIIDHMNASHTISEIVVVADLTGMGAQIHSRYRTYGSKPISFIQDSGSGTAGDLRHLEDVDDFVLWFCDNLCAMDIDIMVDTHLASGCDGTVAVRQRRKEETGFAEVHDGRLVNFREKPVLDLPLCECLGVYVLGAAILDGIRATSGQVNLSYDILQDAAAGGRLAAYDIGDIPWLDAESPAILERNHTLVQSIVSAMGNDPARTR